MHGTEVDFSVTPTADNSLHWQRESGNLAGVVTLTENRGNALKLILLDSVT